jgi:hypothetical protein
VRVSIQEAGLRMNVAIEPRFRYGMMAGEPREITSDTRYGSFSWEMDRITSFEGGHGCRCKRKCRCNALMLQHSMSDTRRLRPTHIPTTNTLYSHQSSPPLSCRSYSVSHPLYRLLIPSLSLVLLLLSFLNLSKGSRMKGLDGVGSGYQSIRARE